MKTIVVGVVRCAQCDSRYTPMKETHRCPVCMQAAVDRLTTEAKKHEKLVLEKQRDAYVAGWFAAAATFNCKSNPTDEFGIAETSFDKWKKRTEQ